MYQTAPTRARRQGRVRRGLIAAAAAGTAAAMFAATAWAGTTITFVRHGESEGNASGYIDTSIPGPHLTPLGQTQADGVPAKLTGYGYDIDAYDGVYASTMVRTPETAAPLAALVDADNDGNPDGVTILGEYDKNNPRRPVGVQEVSAGVIEGASQEEGLVRIVYALVPLGWTLGLRFLAIPGSENGNEFDARVDNAIEDVEAGGDINGDGDINAAVFSHGMTIMAWTLMNVDNPDPLLMLTHSLSNTDVVVVEKNDDGSWTLKQWGDQQVGPANYPTKMFVNVRDLIVAPQTALYNMRLPLYDLDFQEIAEAGVQGVRDVGEATVKFVTDSVNDTADAIRGLIPGTANQPVTTLPAITAASATPMEATAADTPDPVRTVTAVEQKLTDGAEDARDQAEDARDRAEKAIAQIGDKFKKAQEAKAADTAEAVRDNVKKIKDEAQKVRDNVKKIKDQVKTPRGSVKIGNDGASNANRSTGNEAA